MSPRDPWIRRIRGPLSGAACAEAVFAGELVVFTAVAPVRALGALADAHLREAFEGLEPETAQFHLPKEPWLARVARAQRAFARDAEAKRLLAAALEAVGLEPERTYRDKLCLRVNPHGRTHAGGPRSATGYHRDTWGSNVYQQVNWWAPVYPVSSRSTIAVYPRHWREPIANTSDVWDFDELIARRRAGQPYPTVPEPTGPVDTAGGLRPALEPGDLLAFSAAHLHASVPNDSGKTRVSFETRTVTVDDLHAGRAAPNLDGHGTRARFEWFRRVSDGAPFPAGGPASAKIESRAE